MVEKQEDAEAEAMEEHKAEVKEEVEVEVDLLEGENKEEDQIFPAKFVKPLSVLVNHELTLTEAGLRIQPSLCRHTVASVIFVSISVQ